MIKVLNTKTSVDILKTHDLTESWTDDFDDSIVGSVWTEHLGDEGGTITESGEYLRLDNNGYPTSAGEIEAVPYVYINEPKDDFCATVKLGALPTTSDYSMIGISLTKDDDSGCVIGAFTEGALIFSLFQKIINNIIIENITGSGLHYYYRIRKITNDYYFDYSDDGLVWTNLKTIASSSIGFIPTKIGVFNAGTTGCTVSYVGLFDSFTLTSDSNWSSNPKVKLLNTDTSVEVL